MKLKQLFSLLSYIGYFVISIGVSYFMQWITVLFVWGMRFTAADSYPGDFSRADIVILSIAFPSIHFIVLSIYLQMQYVVMSLLDVKFQRRIPFVLNIVITLLLIAYFLKVF